ncbi:cilia- and flagella-associated 53-like [Brachionus plicatilis]|uniref:Cilia- and flagella-associated protein 53 n=1 Tax=Brachionus plicatilis TaxID=10195 RepID=A0A3M7PHX5_BRAPC|nr:cilia- and flagella-associated 53-like [Brachionus plicatilis]
MRDIIGPNPGEFGVLAKPIRPGNENLVQKSNRIKFERETFNASHKLDVNDKIKFDFFTDIDRKAKIKQIDRTVEEIMNQRNFLLFERRKKLKDLLNFEDKMYEQELLSSVVSPLERAAQLREKAKEIKMNKEMEKAAFVQEKLDQKWRSECDELRTFHSKQLQAGMKEEHMRQIEEKVCRNRHKLEEEAIFADLWYQDIQAKKDREDRDAKKALERNMEVAGILKQQMEVLERQKEEEKQIKAENGRLMREKENIDKLEKELLYQKKIEDQAARRRELDLNIKAKLDHEAKRAKEELMFDLKALEDSLISFQNEDIEKAKRKQELMVEQKMYREYLRQQYEEEKRREKELDQIINEEVEKQMQKRLAKWRAEKQARKNLLEKVVRERQQQIIDKIERNMQREQELELEKQEINKIIDFYRHQEELEKLKLREKIRNYGQDLSEQIQYTSLQKRIANDLERQEIDEYHRNELDYQNKLNTTMQSIQEKNMVRRANLPTGFCAKCRRDLNLNSANSDYNSALCRCHD